KDRDICMGSSIELNPGDFEFYEWQNQTTLSKLTINEPGTYWVKVRNDLTCVATDTVIVANFLPKPKGFLPAVDSICQYQEIQLVPLGTFNSYSWSDGSFLRSLTVDKPGQYILEVADLNDCYGKDTVVVYSKVCRTGVFIPNAFTPNADGLNDIFKAIVFGNVVN